MRKAVPLFLLVLCLYGEDSLAYTLGKKTTGTSTETSTTASRSSTTGSCAGDYTAGKSSSSSTSTTSGCSTTPPDVDDDGDGMPSTWELTYTLDKYSAADALTDLDSDYISNLVEYLRSLAPNDNDTDNDTVVDGDDADPSSASSGALSVNGTFSGSSTTENTDVQ